MNLESLDKFSTNLKNTLLRASNLALRYGNEEVRPIHLLASLFEQKGSLGSEVLAKEKIDRKNIDPLLVKNNLVNQKKLPLMSAKTKQVIEKAAVFAFEAQHNYIGTEHLLMAILLVEDEQIKKILPHPERLVKHLESIFKNTSRFPDIASFFNDEDMGDEMIEMPMAGVKQKQRGPGIENDIPALSFFCTDLTNPKIQIKIDPVIGRDDEIERTIHILCRRTKNNPVLIGEPGVGKTAISEGLAKKIVEKKVPPALQDKKILRLDLSLVVAGTMYRGEFEARFKQIIDELARHPEIIIFIDEIHTIIGTGGTGSGATMDAANILKPGLAKGEIRCIGATTSDEYKKHIESDPALERRFQAILVEESSAIESIQILKGLRGNYEKYHQTKIEDSAIEAAVNFSEKYIQDKCLPDKAIDLIDEAAAKKKVNFKPDPLTINLNNLKKKLDTIQKQKIQLVRQEKFEEAISLKKKEAIIKTKINNLSKAQLQGPPVLKDKITHEDVAEIISKITGVPTHELVAEEKKQLLNLETTLNRDVIGQKEA
ncbi:MAG: ATP-dependent Clp protease ATP-binding subunit, partial [Patescibacteria group bacterium]